MQQSDLTRMAIASAVAIVAMSYLAIDAGVLNTNAVKRPVEMAQASIFGAAMAQNHLALAVQEWTRGAEKPAVEQCLATD